MFTAEEAKANVINYQAAFYAKVNETVTEILETMSKSIEFHSRCGLTSAEFIPYTNSRFPCDKAKEIAQDQFEKAFKSTGYNIIINDIEKNVLKVSW